MFIQITNKEAHKMLRKNKMVYVTALKWKPYYFCYYDPAGSADSISGMIKMIKNWIIPCSGEDTGRSIIYWKYEPIVKDDDDDDLPF